MDRVLHLSPLSAPLRCRRWNTSFVLGRLRVLELVLGTSVHIDHLYHDVCRRRGLTMTNAGNATSPT